MMYCKAKLFHDHEIADRILTTENPANHKRLGREVRGFVESDWIAKREHYVYIGCFAKFQQNPSAKTYLLSTGNSELVEASPTDKIWGIGLGKEDPRIHDRNNWKGLNLLGKVLMRVRAKFNN